MYMDYLPSLPEQSEGPQPIEAMGDAMSRKQRNDILLARLRRTLKERKGRESKPSASETDSYSLVVADLDQYEQQRLGKKILWQYDKSGKKIPLLRRSYIG